MTLEEIAERAAFVADDQWTNDNARALARAVLAMLPVVRAAVEWRDHGPGQSHCEEEDCSCTSTVCRLKQSISKMRAAIGEGE